MTDRSPFPHAYRRFARRSFAGALAGALVLALHGVADAAPHDASPVHVVADAPAPRPIADDHVLLISTRSLGTRCDAAVMATGLRCEQLDRSARGPGHWKSVGWDAVLADFAEPLPTIVYVHGNRVDPGVDRSHGLTLYQSLPKRNSGAIRYVIWSWPSSQIRGRLKDYEVKAARTGPAGWQLAWAVDQWPTDSPLAMVGYSYGARVVTGALHLLGGGRIEQLALAERVHPSRPPVRTALVAAALDAHWLRAGGYHGRAVSQVDRLLLINNQLDPAMRFYPWSPEGRHTPALGFAGPTGRETLGPLAGRIQSFDLTAEVGRHHALGEYLASARVRGVLEQIVALPPVPRDGGESSLAGRGDGGERQ